VKVFRLGALLAFAPFLAAPQDLREFEKKVTEFSLSNGLHFIIVERHESPVVSFRTYVDVGSVDDPSGETGLAHMFEHMAFKGTDTIGSRDWPAEKKALDEIEEVYDRLDAEQNKGPKADRSKVSALKIELQQAIDRAQAFVEPNQYTRVIEENGGAGLNASTSLDSTQYFYSLPSNRLELWFFMESHRFLRPVFREFYKERDVVMEEHRMRVESSPQGKLVQNFLAGAFEAHPYRNPPGGWPSDIQNLRATEARRFFQRYYVPANITMAIVGDVNPAEARSLAERYFGPMQARPMPPRVHTLDPPQGGPKTVVVNSPSQPILAIGYKRPDQYSPDDPVFDVIEMILTSGRTGRLYKELVEQKKLSLVAQSAATFPAGRYPNLFIFFLVPAMGHTVADNQAALNELLTRFLTEPPDAASLARAKTQARAGVIRRLADNGGLAAMLSEIYGAYGDWRKLFTSLDDIDKVTAADVVRVARQYFINPSKTVAYTEQPGGRQ
jgi:predicted Zn-dependent peptidase